MCIYIYSYIHIISSTLPSITSKSLIPLLCFPTGTLQEPGKATRPWGIAMLNWRTQNQFIQHVWRYRNVPSSKLPRQFGNEQWTQLEDIWTLSKTGIFQLAMLVYLSVSSLYKISDACHIRYLNPLVNIMENSWIGGGNSNIFYFHPYFGEDFQFDDHIFQRGWFNHQLEFFRCARVTGGCCQSFVCSHFQESYIYGLIF